MADDPVINVRDGDDVHTQAEQLGIQSPERFVILPQNYFVAESIDELRLNQEALTIEKLVEEEGLRPDEIIDSTEYPVTHTWSAETIGPLIHFTTDFLANNWQGVLTVISTLMTYYSTQRESSVQFTFSVEQSDGTHTQVQYEGSPEQLSQVTDLLKEQRNSVSEEEAKAEIDKPDDGEEAETVRHDEEEFESA